MQKDIEGFLEYKKTLENLLENLEAVKVKENNEVIGFNSNKCFINKFFIFISHKLLMPWRGRWKNNNDIIEILEKLVQTDYEIIDSMIQQFYKMKLELDFLQKEKIEQDAVLKYVKNRLNISSDLKLLEQGEIDYFDFENKFRGSREVIKVSQREYVKFYTKFDSGNVLEIGSGRGEFLELLKENGVKAVGIDNYQPFVDYCNNMGLHVVYGDALSYLNSLEDDSLNGIFMSQVIEHLSTDYAISLIKKAYEKMKKGSYFIMETPNSQNLSTYWNFYLDASHIKPTHILTAEYWFTIAGFEEIERYYNPFSKTPFQIPEVISNCIENLEDVNQSIKKINDNIFGYCDYTLIVRK
ncbi:class I SAM-dependent methyltransferase [Lacrimispora sp.]|uniref:class I SAM-dependent methyltransferase n=1 Tax=Lacrimispora sp. TaxID=2719234 RepID=UPI003996A0CE